MKSRKSSFSIISVVVAIVAIVYVLYILYPGFGKDDAQTSYKLQTLPDSPLYATYVHQDSSVTLEDGNYTEGDVHIETVAEPAYGDVDGDTKADAVLLLADTKESTSQYYLALALADDMGFLGMDTVPLPKHKTPVRVSITDEMVQLFYEGGVVGDTPGDIFVLTGVHLERHEGVGDIVTGTYVMEDKTQIFQPCDAEQSYEISNDSRSLSALEAIYTQRTYNRPPGTGVYVVLTGTVTGESGTTTQESFTVDSIIRVPEAGSCEKRKANN